MFTQTHVELIDGKPCIVANRRYATNRTNRQRQHVAVFTQRMNAITRQRKS